MSAFDISSNVNVQPQMSIEPTGLTLRKRFEAQVLGLAVGDAFSAPWAGASSLGPMSKDSLLDTHQNVRRLQVAHHSASTTLTLIFMESLSEGGLSDLRARTRLKLSLFATGLEGVAIRGSNLGLAGRLRRLYGRPKNMDSQKDEEASVSAEFLASIAPLSFACRTAEDRLRLVDVLVDVLALEHVEALSAAYLLGGLSRVTQGADAAEHFRQSVLDGAERCAKAWCRRALVGQSGTLTRLEGMLAIHGAQIASAESMTSLIAPADMDMRTVPLMVAGIGLLALEARAKDLSQSLARLPRRGCDVDVILPLIASLASVQLGKGEVLRHRAKMKGFEMVEKRIASFWDGAKLSTPLLEDEIRLSQRVH